MSIVDEELSIGDFVLSGGEIPVLLMVEAISRFVPVSWEIWNRSLTIPFTETFWITPLYKTKKHQRARSTRCSPERRSRKDRDIQKEKKP
jgi:tRNA (guanine-N1)-methyltransferase